MPLEIRDPWRLSLMPGKEQRLCPRGYGFKVGDIGCEECDDWVTVKILPKSPEHPQGWAVQQCKLVEVVA